jgi:hypothetical protein
VRAGVAHLGWWDRQEREALAQPIKVASHTWRADVSITDVNLYHMPTIGCSRAVDRMMGHFAHDDTAYAFRDARK